MRKLGQLLTSEEVEKKLSLIVLEVILKRATVSFPLGSVGVPSPVVLVQGSSSIELEGSQWRLCVVPVLEDESWAVLKTPKGREIAKGDLFAHWQRLIGIALKKSFEANGF